MIPERLIQLKKLGDIRRSLLIMMAFINQWTTWIYCATSNGQQKYQNDHPGFAAVHISKYINLACYSCMSPIYSVKIRGLDDSNELDVWEDTKKFYNQPEKFTKSCNTDTYNANELTARNCSDSCIWLSMENVIAGKSYRGFVRGCLSDLIDYNRTTMRFIAYRAQCVPIALKSLFVPRSDRVLQYPDQRVTLCVCHSPRCNGASRSSALLGPYPRIVLIFCILWMLVIFPYLTSLSS